MSNEVISDYEKRFSLFALLRTLTRDFSHPVDGSPVREKIRKAMIRQFVTRQFVALYSRFVGLLVVLVCAAQMEERSLLTLVVALHGITLVLNRRYSHNIIEAIDHGDDFTPDLDKLRIGMGVTAFLWGTLIWVIPHNGSLSPAEFVINLTVIVAISLMVVTSALHQPVLSAVLIGALAGMIPPLIIYTPIAGIAPAFGFIALMMVLLAYSQLIGRQARGLALMQMRSRTAFKRLRKVNSSLVSAVNQLHWQSERDWLTGLRNRGAFEKSACGMLARAEEGTQFAVILIDLDRFKQINDTYGHDIGDSVLENVGGELNAWEQMDRRRLAARWGGEEFVIIVQLGDDTTPEQLANELRFRLSDRNPLLRAPHEPDVSVSIGLSVEPAPFGLKQQIKKADQALYLAKAEGRDCWRIAA